jgi:hypothetical protein
MVNELRFPSALVDSYTTVPHSARRSIGHLQGRVIQGITMVRRMVIPVLARTFHGSFIKSVLYNSCLKVSSIKKIDLYVQ